MGTRFELILEGASRAGCRKLAEAAFEWLHFAEQRLSRFRKDSWLTQLHERAPGWVRVDADLLALLELCRDLHQCSDGAFDLAVGRAIEEAGDPRGSSVQGRVAGPIDLDPAGFQARLCDPAVRLDFGAVGKGWALDLMAGELRELGIERALLHGGSSSILAIGSPPDRPGWGISIQGVKSVSASIDLRDQALAVSSTTEQVRELAGKTVSHIVDPVNPEGELVPASSAAVSDSAARADAIATALLVHVAYRQAPAIPAWPGIRAALVEVSRKGSLHRLTSTEHDFKLRELEDEDVEN